MEHAIDGDTAFYDVPERELPCLDSAEAPTLARQIICDGIIGGQKTDILIINSPTLSHQSTIAFHLYSCAAIVFNTPSIRLATSSSSDQFSQERNKNRESLLRKKPSFPTHRVLTSDTAHSNGYHHSNKCGLRLRRSIVAIA